MTIFFPWPFVSCEKIEDEAKPDHGTTHHFSRPVVYNFMVYVFANIIVILPKKHFFKIGVAYVDYCMDVYKNFIRPGGVNI